MACSKPGIANKDVIERENNRTTKTANEQNKVQYTQQDEHNPSSAQTSEHWDDQNVDFSQLHIDNFSTLIMLLPGICNKSESFALLQ